jgi:hypothetical protein
MFQGEKLTKKFYDGLKTGMYLVSDLGDTPLTRDFEAYVAPEDQRTGQWQEIKNARVDQRGCSGFATKEEFQQYQKGWTRRPDGGWHREK